VPALLELYGQPYAFSDPLVCAATLDKAVAKRLAVASGLATAGFRVVRRESDAAAVDLPFPLFVKPLCEGTGKGVDEKSRVADRAQLVSACRDLLARFRQPVLVEEYLPGREFTTGILGTGDEARVLGTLEVRIRSSAPAADYTHEIKENWQRHVEYDTPTPGPLLTEVENLALACYRCLECRDTARVDMRLDARGRPAFMEVNPLPGLNPGHSDLPMIAERAGLTYRELIAAIVDSAARRNGAGHGAASHTRRTP
jgi:D-alanine-D-alanine ligase